MAAFHRPPGLHPRVCAIAKVDTPELEAMYRGAGDVTAVIDRGGHLIRFSYDVNSVEIQTGEYVIEAWASCHEIGVTRGAPGAALLTSLLDN